MAVVIYWALVDCSFECSGGCCAAVSAYESKCEAGAEMAEWSVYAVESVWASSDVLTV